MQIQSMPTLGTIFGTGRFGVGARVDITFTGVAVKSRDEVFITLIIYRIRR